MKCVFWNIKQVTKNKLVIADTSHIILEILGKHDLAIIAEGPPDVQEATMLAKEFATKLGPAWESAAADTGETVSPKESDSILVIYNTAKVKVSGVKTWQPAKWPSGGRKPVEFVAKIGDSTSYSMLCWHAPEPGQNTLIAQGWNAIQQFGKSFDVIVGDFNADLQPARRSGLRQASPMRAQTTLTNPQLTRVDEYGDVFTNNNYDKLFVSKDKEAKVIRINTKPMPIFSRVASDPLLFDQGSKVQEETKGSGSDDGVKITEAKKAPEFKKPFDVKKTSDDVAMFETKPAETGEKKASKREADDDRDGEEQEASRYSLTSKKKPKATPKLVAQKVYSVSDHVPLTFELTD